MRRLLCLPSVERGKGQGAKAATSCSRAVLRSVARAPERRQQFRQIRRILLLPSRGASGCRKPEVEGTQIQWVTGQISELLAADLLQNLLDALECTTFDWVGWYEIRGRRGYRIDAPGASWRSLPAGPHLGRMKGREKC